MMRAIPALTRAIGLTLCASFLVAQQTPPAAPAPAAADAVFKVTTSLVQVDAVVTDSKGQYITDLTPADFTVFQDGKPQPITHFSYIRVNSSVPAASTQIPMGANLPPAPAAPLRPQDVRRTIVLMIDDLHLSFESMAYLRSALKKFVEQQMQPGDLVAICRTAAGTGALQQFTADKRILLSIINGLHFNLNISLNFFDPYGKAGSMGMVESGATGGDQQLALGALGAVGYIVGALRDMPGRKSIVLFSDGFVLFTPGQKAAIHTTMSATRDSIGAGDLTDALRKLIDRANRSGTVIYTIHTLGLQPLLPSAADRVDMTGFSGQQANATLRGIADLGSDRDLAFNSVQQGLAYIALETGGVPFENGNDLNYGLARVLEDQQGYYLIGFRPPDDTFGLKHSYRDYHRLSVKVTRAGLHVRSRLGFFGETDDQLIPSSKTPLEQMRRAMLSPFHSADVHLRLTALYAEVPKRGPVVRNLLHIDTRDLTFFKSPGNTTSDIEIVAVATSMGDVPVETVARSFTVHAPSSGEAEAVKEGALYTLDVPLKKRGAYQIHVAVRDVATGRVGSASQFLEIPELKKGRVALTSILLQNADRPADQPAWTGMTPAVREFQRGGEIEYFCLVENNGRKLAPADLDSQIHIVRDGKSVYSGPAKLFPIDGGGLAFNGKLKLGPQMTPGDYYLGIVSNRPNAPGNSAAVQWTDFEILP